MNNNIKLSSKFYNGLKKHELSKDLLISQGWSYSGGRTCSQRPNCHSRYFNIVYGNNAIQPDFIIIVFVEIDYMQKIVILQTGQKRKH